MEHDRSSVPSLRRALVLALVFPLATLGCGGNDASTTTAGDRTPSEETGAPDSTRPPDATDVAADETGSSVSGSVGDCDDVVAVEEAGALFGEPAVLDEDGSSRDERIGQVVCVWSTVEDPDDLEDLASQLLIVQIYDGTIPGANFYAPDDVYPDADVLDLGDEAYVNVGGGVDIGWLSGNRATFMSWSAIDLSGAGPAAASLRDAVVALARNVEQRLG